MFLVTVQRHSYYKATVFCSHTLPVTQFLLADYGLTLSNIRTF